MVNNSGVSFNTRKDNNTKMSDHMWLGNEEHSSRGMDALLMDGKRRG